VTSPFRPRTCASSFPHENGAKRALPSVFFRSARFWSLLLLLLCPSSHIRSVFFVFFFLITVDAVFFFFLLFGELRDFQQSRSHTVGVHSASFFFCVGPLAGVWPSNAIENLFSFFGWLSYSRPFPKGAGRNLPFFFSRKMVCLTSFDADLISADAKNAAFLLFCCSFERKSAC